MHHTNSNRSALLALAVAGALHCAQAAAQDKDPADGLEQIVVTGSHIRGATDSGAVAVSVIDAETLLTFAQTSTGEMLENVAQAGTFEINGAADGPNDARGDIATVNLRGLGTGNTLVLLNGRRLAAHAVNQDIGSTPRQFTNVNAFPSSGIDRVEVLRDGASALYGADATAGVVNTILSSDYDDDSISVYTSRLEGTDSKEWSADFSTGLEFNGGDTRLLLVGSYYSRDGLYAGELDAQFFYVDKRAFLGNSPWATETTDFRNTSTSSPFGQYQAGRIDAGRFVGQRVRQGANALTSTTGVFHIQPCSSPGTRATLGDFGEGCMGLDDAALDAGLRYDFNYNQPNNSLGEGVNIANDSTTAKGRQLISDADRLNGYALFEHDVAEDMSIFGEVLFYDSSTDSNRAAQPMDSGLAFLIVPKTNYWNPFGPVGSPNRLPNLNVADVPAEGRDVLIQNWRPTDLGVRFISTESTTYRLMAGLRGTGERWDWETAIAQSANETEDVESNRLSKTLLAAELAKSTADAINPFGGPNANSDAQWDRARISSRNVGETRLTTADVRASSADLFDNWAGPVGVAFGAEWRRESYLEDRDPRLDGSIIFSEENVSGRSDVVGVSPTADSGAHRYVWSTYGEALVPLHRGEGTFVNDLTLQLAARGEYFSDIGDGTVKPKIALSWFPVDFLNFRAAYAEGFRVPNLVQLNRGDVSRLNLGNEDYWRTTQAGAAIVPGDAVSTGDAYMPSVRQSNPNLENEDTETYIVGMILDLGRVIDSDWLKDLRFSVDYWRFEQTDVIGAFGDQEALALDFLLRKQGGSNPNVVRAELTDADIAAFTAWNAANPNDQRVAAGQVLYLVDPYINLDEQTADGFDIGLAAAFDLGAGGDLNFSIDATYLDTLDVVRNELLTALANDPAFADEFAALQVDRVRLDGNPEWRASAALRWRLGGFGAGVSMRYVSDFIDTSADLDQNGDGIPEYWKVEDYTRVNAYADYRFGFGPVEQLSVRLGVNNLSDESPPLVDESLGYLPEYHPLKGREFYLQVTADF
jgi:outer membrane receptor protein involved in Fe transport